MIASSSLRPGLRALAALFGVAFACRTGTATADLGILPGADGNIGAWLAAGPLPESVRIDGTIASQASLGQPLTHDLPGLRWQLLAWSSPVVDLAQQLHVAPSDLARLLLVARLEVEFELDGWLLISVDGNVTLWIDGREHWRRDGDHLRGDTWDVIPLRLSPGVHDLVLGLSKRSKHWALAVRIVQRADLAPPQDLRVWLKGASAADRDRLLGLLVALSVQPGLSRDGYRPSLEVSFPCGITEMEPVKLVATARLDGKQEPLWVARLGELAPRKGEVERLVARLPPLRSGSLSRTGGGRRLEVELALGEVHATRSIVVTAEAPGLLGRALDAREALSRARRPDLLDPEAVDATLELMMERLVQASATGAPSVVKERLQELLPWVMALEQGRDPLQQAGVFELARRSLLDGRPSPMWVHLPASYGRSAPGRAPLTVLLHGYGGSPRGVMKAFLGRSGGGPHPAVEGFVVAPHAYGNSFYRGPGEHDVLDAIDWMLARYPIDPGRVSITGVSMGGTGAAALALMHPGRFSAVAALAGYHSYFLRRDLGQSRLRPWEQARAAHRSPVNWAASGRNLPLFVAQGRRDLPLANSRVLVDAYRGLGYSVTEQWPDTGHAVWEEVYAGARLWPWLARARRADQPRRVTLTTDALRYGKLDWVTVTELERPGQFGWIDARLEAKGRVVISTRGLVAFELDRAGAGLDRQEVTVEVDGTPLLFSPEQSLCAYRAAEGWRPGPAPSGTLRKRAGLEGPIDDVFLEPLVFVYGSLDPAWTRANQEVAVALSKRGDWAEVRYPVVADRELDSHLSAGRAWVLVGNAENNSVLQRLDARLPLGTTAQGLRFGSRVLVGPGLGTMFVYPNPEQPDHYLLAVEAVDIPGLYQSLSLPRLLPDFVVYDGRLRPAAGQQVLGAAEVRSAGFFDNAWLLPEAAVN